MRHNLLSGIAGVVTLTFMAGGPYAIPQHEPHADSTAQGRWSAVYQAGAAPFDPGIRIEVAIDKDQVILAGKKGAVFSIPASAITTVLSSLTIENPVTRSQAEAWGGLAKNLMFLPFGGSVVGATYPKSKYAYISFAWSERETDQEVQFRLDRKDYDPFLKQLQKSTGKEWKNLQSEWERLRQAAGTDHPIPLRLDRKVRMGRRDVKPGSYQLIVLEGAANQADGYLFPSDQVAAEHLISTCPVEIAAATSEEAQTNGVIYKQDDSGASRISEVRTSGRLLRFP